MGGGVGTAYRGKRTRDSVLNLLSLRSLLDVQVQIWSKQLDAYVCSSEERYELEIKFGNNVYRDVSMK